MPRKAKRAPKRDARAAYAEKRAIIDTLLREIAEGLDAHAAKAGDAIHWGHVGDLGHHRERLQDLRDSLWRLGEYADDPDSDPGYTTGKTFDRNGNPITVSIPR